MYPAACSRLAEHDHPPAKRGSASSARPKGPRNVKHDPAPGVLLTTSKPPIRLSSWRAIASPSPVPP